MFRITLFVCVAAIATGFSGCVSSSEKFFETGRDARAYNPQTGRYEWQE